MKTILVLSTFHEADSEMVDVYNSSIHKKFVQQVIIDKLASNIDELEDIPLSKELGTLSRKVLKNDK